MALWTETSETLLWTPGTCEETGQCMWGWAVWGVKQGTRQLTGATHCEGASLPTVKVSDVSGNVTARVPWMARPGSFLKKREEDTNFSDGRALVLEDMTFCFIFSKCTKCLFSKGELMIRLQNVIWIIRLGVWQVRPFLWSGQESTTRSNSLKA